MELRQLEYFAEVCRVRNFTKASENLHVAQPAVTKSIQRLEEELGTQLIDRTVKPLRLTERGERFYRRVEDILRRLEDAAAEAAEQVNSQLSSGAYTEIKQVRQAILTGSRFRRRNIDNLIPLTFRQLR